MPWSRLITSCRCSWSPSLITNLTSCYIRSSWRLASSCKTVIRAFRAPRRSALEQMCAPEGIEAVVARLSLIGHGPHPPVELGSENDPRFAFNKHSSFFMVKASLQAASKSAAVLVPLYEVRQSELQRLLMHSTFVQQLICTCRTHMG